MINVFAENTQINEHYLGQNSMENKRWGIGAFCLSRDFFASDFGPTGTFFPSHLISVQELYACVMS